MREVCTQSAQERAQRRARVYEDKVVDYSRGEADVTEKAVTREGLFEEDEE